ncbi:BQ2448_2394 [Microbotryum intermedium]|uniref:BQ2448_2394 protein n=1 Tax=Microbotryum intermedium TaxID=269621 RepID=A0A238FBU4_9BASI|nr:BQ2448_2394 [Microbotryum intermedium]
MAPSDSGANFNSSTDRDASLSLDWPTCDSPTTTGPTGTACPNTLAITPSQGSHPPGPNCSLDVPPPIPRSRLTSRIRVLKGLLIGRGPYGGGGKDSAGEGSDGGTVLDGLDLKERLERVERELCSWML